MICTLTRSQKHPNMDIISEYVEFSDAIYYGEEGCSDYSAMIKKPFLDYQNGETVKVTVEYTSGKVTVNGKQLAFAIVDEY